MGRRALPKLDPTLDVSGVLRTLEDLPRPWSTAAEFGRAAPLEIEIGSGKGLFIRAAAAQDSTKDFLGCEIAKKYARFAAARAVQRGLTNVRMVAGDAVRLITELLPNEVAAAVHVYFPDPWWKKKHHKRRMMRDEVVRQIERILLPGGVLHFWTDVEEYYQEALATLAESTRLVGPLPVAERPAEHDLDYRTHFERRMRLHGHAVHRCEFHKPIESPMNSPETLKVLRIDGEVERPAQLTAADLSKLDPAHQIADVSAIDPKRRGRAIWLRGLLAHVGAKTSAKFITLHAAADDFHASVPLATVIERGLFIYEQDGQPLPTSAGGPFRFYIRDYLACHSADIDECANVKFVDHIELTATRGQDNRPHDDTAHAALHKRADSPQRSQRTQRAEEGRH